LINRDFADIKSIMKEAGSAFMGIGTGVGENRAQAAARNAIASPLLEVSINGARGILFSVTGGPDLTMAEVEETSKIITEHADADANIIFGATIDQKMVDQLKVSVIATGFDESKLNLQRMMQRPASKSFTPQPSPAIAKPAAEEGDGKEQPPPAEIPPNEMGEEYEVPTFLRLGRQH